MDSATTAAMNIVRSQELRKNLVWLVLLRAVVLLLGLNLADPLRILPDHIGRFAFLPLANTLIGAITLAYLPLWWSDRLLLPQLYFQIGADLAIVTWLVAYTGGIESAYLSFYLLIIIYCNLMLGRAGGMAGASLSVLLYSGLMAGATLGVFNPATVHPDYSHIAFRVFFHAIGFFAVAFLGAYLVERVRSVEWELQSKINTLQRLQRLNEHIVSSLRSGLITTDMDGRVTLFNRTAEDLLGRNGADVLGQPLRRVICEEIWMKMANGDLAGSNYPLRHEEWLQVDVDCRKYFGFSISPLEDESHTQLGYILSFQDLTSIKGLEAELRVKDRMAAIGRMAAGIAHEIRNPLTAMQGSVEVLRSRSNLPKRDERLLDILIKESDRLNKFVEDFLHLARPDKVERDQLDLIPLLQDSVELLENSATVKMKYHIVFLHEVERMPIRGNSNQLRQVFWNLAQNALRAMPAGGVLTILAKAAQDGGALAIFKDTGMGMSQAEKDRLFQPFQSGFARGTGLGLSITFQIMEDHGGRITIDSEKDKGTEVTLYFPPQAEDWILNKSAALR